jgi:hypothetical protein
MSIDTAAILAAKYKADPAPLKAAVLGQGDASINPYAALRALQLQQEAQRFQMAQAAMQGQQYQNQPSMVEQAVMPGMQQQPQQPPMPPQGQPQEPAPEGLAGMPVPEQNFAPGGIVAFADEGLVEDEYGGDIPFGAIEDMRPSPGSPASYEQFAGMLPGLMRDVQAQEFKPMSEEDFATTMASRRKLLEEGAGPSPFVGFQAKLDELEQGRAKNLKQASGLALLAGIEDVLKPGGLARGLGGAAGKFASVYGQALTADKAEQRALMSMNMNLATAKRSEDLGLNREALAAASQARQDYNAAQRFKIDKTKALANLAISGARATKPTGGADKGPKNFDSLAAKYVAADLYRNQRLPEGKRLPNELVEEKAYERAAKDWGRISAGDIVDIKKRGATVQEREATTGETRVETEKEKLTTEQGKLVNEQMRKWEISREGIEAKRKGDVAYQNAKAAKEQEIRGRFKSTPSGNKNSSLSGKTATIQGAPKGSVYGKQLDDGRYEVLDSSGKLIGHTSK